MQRRCIKPCVSLIARSCFDGDFHSSLKTNQQIPTERLRDEFQRRVSWLCRRTITKDQGTTNENMFGAHYHKDHSSSSLLFYPIHQLLSDMLTTNSTTNRQENSPWGHQHSLSQHSHEWNRCMYRYKPLRAKSLGMLPPHATGHVGNDGGTNHGQRSYLDSSWSKLSSRRRSGYRRTHCNDCTWTPKFHITCQSQWKH